jgi:hypothetical protein
VVPRTALCDKFCYDGLKCGYENGSLRQILSRSNGKWLREQLSATNFALPDRNMALRTALCDKFCFVELESGYENGSLRQILLRLTGKWFRERFSATDFASSNSKVVPRTALGDKFCLDRMESGYENGSLRQILLCQTETWLRERLSATSFASSNSKVVTRTALGDKFCFVELESGYENGSLRQILLCRTETWLRERLSATNFVSIEWKVVPRLALCDKFCSVRPKHSFENGSLRQILLRRTEIWSRDPISATNFASSN